MFNSLKINNGGKEMKKKLLCIFLVATLVLSTGCGKSSDDDKKTEATSASSGVEEVSNLNSEGLPILKEPETFTIAVQQTSPLKSAAEKQCVIDAEKATNVTIKWNEIPTTILEQKHKIKIKK